MKNRKNAEIKYELSVGEVAGRSGAAVSAIHFYERKGLISSRRNSGNQRIYPRSVLRRIAVIKFAQTLGIPLAEIKEALDSLPENEIVGVRDWQKLSGKWQQDLDARIEKLERLRGQLTHCIGCGCLSMKECWLRNPSDTLAEKGVGPVLLE